MQNKGYTTILKNIILTLECNTSLQKKKNNEQKNNKEKDVQYVIPNNYI